jgi:hypothetical protein
MVESVRSSDGTEIVFDRSGDGPPLVLVVTHSPTAPRRRRSAPVCETPSPSTSTTGVDAEIAATPLPTQSTGRLRISPP